MGRHSTCVLLRGAVAVRDSWSFAVWPTFLSKPSRAPFGMGRSAGGMSSGKLCTFSVATKPMA